MFKGLFMSCQLNPHIAYLRMGKVNTGELRDKYFLKKGIKNIRRLRQVWVKKFGVWMFKDVDSDLAKTQVKRIDEDIHTKEDIDKYMAKLASKKLDTKKPLWDILVKEDYDQDTSVVFILVNHLLSDGIGIITLISYMNDNHNPKNTSHYRNIPFFAYYVLPLIYLPVGIFRFTVAGLKTK